jgi:hypothetical protein
MRCGHGSRETARGRRAFELAEQAGDLAEVIAPLPFVGIAGAAGLAFGRARAGGFEPGFVLANAGGFAGARFVGPLAAFWVFGVRIHVRGQHRDAETQREL